MKVKVTLMSAEEPEMRRLSLLDNYDFVEFKKKVSELFNKTDTELLFHWKDSEDDMITMSSEEEFQEALKSVSDGLLRVFLKKVNDCINGFKEGNADHENSDFRMNMDSDTDVRPSVWGRRLGRRGKGCGLGWRSFDASPARRWGRHQPACSEKRGWRRMRRALKLSEGLDKPKHGCQRFRRREARQHGDRCDWMSSNVFPEGGVDEYCRTDRSTGCRMTRRWQRPLSATTGGCRWSRMRKRENIHQMTKNRKRCRRANSAPPARFHADDERHSRRGRRLYGRSGQTRRCRSASLPPRGRSSEYSAGCCRRRFGHPKRTFLIKLKVKNAQFRGCSSDDESGNTRERRCLGRRCKSYRRRAMMEADKLKENVDASVTPEEDMGPRMETLSLNDDADIQKDQQEGTGKRERRCRRRKHGYQEVEDEEENDRPERRRGKCHRKCRDKNERNEDLLHPQEIAPEEENNKNECSNDERGERRRRMKEYRRALREQNGVECCHTNGKRGRVYHKYATLKVCMDGNLRPKKLARKLYKMFNQITEVDGETSNDQNRNPEHEDWSMNDFEGSRYHRICRRHQSRGFRRFRAKSPEFSRREVGGFRPRGWYRRDSPL